MIISWLPIFSWSIHSVIRCFCVLVFDKVLTIKGKKHFFVDYWPAKAKLDSLNNKEVSYLHWLPLFVYLTNPTNKKISKTNEFNILHSSYICRSWSSCIVVLQDVSGRPRWPIRRPSLCHLHHYHFLFVRFKEEDDHMLLISLYKLAKKNGECRKLRRKKNSSENFPNACLL